MKNQTQTVNRSGEIVAGSLSRTGAGRLAEAAGRLFVALGILAAATLSVQAEILLDDTWADGTRTDHNPPTESAWYASTLSLT